MNKKSKLNPDQRNWADNIQTKAFPSWIEAFDYAYQLGYNNGKRDNEFLEAAKDVMERHHDLFKKLKD